MTEPTPPPRRPLATFLRASSGPAPTDGTQVVPQDEDAPQSDSATAQDSDADNDTDRQPDIAAAAADNDVIPATAAEVPPAPADLSGSTAAQDDAGDAAFKRLASESSGPPLAATPAPSFMRAAEPSLPTPRWQWSLVGGLVLLLALQITLADRARLAADAGSRPWIGGLCSVLRCSLPAWQEPAAFSMISRDVRPVPGQPGALQVQASFRNDARWAQAWPSLRLSLADADGRVIGTRVFAPHDYLDPGADTAAVLEPGQSAQIAFRVREPAASTVAFTFEFL